jgi:hypothetical protein
MTLLITYLKSIFGFKNQLKSSKGVNFLEYPASYRVKILRTAGREAKKAQDDLLTRYESKYGSNFQ